MREEDFRLFAQKVWEGSSKLVTFFVIPFPALSCKFLYSIWHYHIINYHDIITYSHCIALLVFSSRF